MAKGRRKKADVIERGFTWEYVASLMQTLGDEYGVRISLEFSTHKYHVAPYAHISSVPKFYDEYQDPYGFCTVARAVDVGQAMYPKDVADLIWAWREEIDSRPACWGKYCSRRDKQTAYEMAVKAEFDRPPWELGE